MNVSQTLQFQEAIIFAEYVIKMALNELSELDQQSIKMLQSLPKYKKDIADLIQGIETAVKSLSQAREVTNRLFCINMEADQ